jgi:ABC-type polysaccharide/polyol phosphate transport system ATPase subunit
MTPPPAILCENVHKRFHLYERNTRSLRRLFIDAVLRRPKRPMPYFALTGFNLRLMHGEAVALLGRNGSGKSTALRVMAGIYAPTTGTVVVNGRLTAVIELGAGFHPELTGTENVALYGAIMGLRPRDLKARFEAIAEFAEIGDFMETPVKYYSSGMQARLAFAVAVCAEHEILLLDEVLAVGDEKFRQKCLDHLAGFHARGGTLVLASHDLAPLRRLCSRAIWLDAGRQVMVGPLDEVADAFHAGMAGAPGAGAGGQPAPAPSAVAESVPT